MNQACVPLNITIFGVLSLYQCCSRTIKSHRLFAAGFLGRETSGVFPRWGFL